MAANWGKETKGGKHKTEKSNIEQTCGRYRNQNSKKVQKSRVRENVRNKEKRQEKERKKKEQ